ncbi:MAG: peptidylprolyl isomerase [Gammaproteobacteria bacterium]|nr:peptidylprolyl isomerase [Gammaproteobacteria bacterium]
MAVRTARSGFFLSPAVAPALLGVLLCAAPTVAQVAAPAATAAGDVRIATGRTVAIRYTLTLDDGTTVQTNADGPPLSYVAGQGQVIPGLEAALEGKGATDRVRVKIRPEDAYGPVEARLMQEVPLDKIPEDARRVGTLLSAQGFDGPIRVAEVRADTVVLDFNHPLAGKALTFDVLVLSVN